MNFIPRLLLIAIAAAALLIGVQVPNFVDQYEKRLDAHFIEVQNNIKPFQDIANRFHNGSLESLILKHEQSPDPTFHAEGAAIDNMYQRLQRFAREKQSLATDLPRKLVFVATRADRELVRETYRNYSFGLLLDREAVFAGLIAMAIVVVFIELLAALLRTFLPRRRPSTLA